MQIKNIQRLYLYEIYVYMPLRLLIHNSKKWVSPAILAVICQQVMHLSTDISFNNPFWINPLRHLYELTVCIPLAYYGSWKMRSFIEKEIYHNKFIHSISKEYYLWTFYFLLAVVIYVFYTHRLLNVSDSVGDYVIAVITCVPILLFYYTLIRGEYNKRKYEYMISELSKSNAAKAEADIRERIYESKMDFFTDIAHEFCTPLTLISGPCNIILNQKNVDPSVIKYTNVINRNAKRMNSLISDLMDFKQIESGYKQPEIAKLNVSDIADRVTDAFKINVSGSGIKIVKQYGVDIVWNSDEKFLTTILVNLVSNAVKYSPDGKSVKVEIGVLDENLIIKVINEGKGISREDIDNIFNRFAVLENYGKQKGWKQNGLGLAITASMVKLLSGTIEVKSIPGDTTVFTVNLPYLKTEAIKNANTYDINDSIVREFLLPGIQYSYKEGRPTVAVIDDNPEMLWLICDILSEEYNVLPIKDSNEALEILRKNHTDIILCDIMMEGMDGIKLTELLKSDKNTSHIPLIIISAIHDIEIQTEVINAGAELYITKPFDNKYLKTTIQRLLNRKKDLKDYFASPLSAYELDMGKLQHAEHRKFLKKIYTIINKNIQNKNLSSDLIANELNISTRSLYRKVKEITDKSLLEVIHDGRLLVAENLLLKSKLSINEIVFKSGFSSRTSFYRAFTKKHGYSPKDFVEKNNLNNIFDDKLH